MSCSPVDFVCGSNLPLRGAGDGVNVVAQTRGRPPSFGVFDRFENVVSEQARRRT